MAGLERQRSAMAGGCLILAVAATRGRRGRRAALRAVFSGVLAAGVARLARRAGVSVPVAASSAATTGAAMEWLPVGLPLAAVAAGVAGIGGREGVDQPGHMVAGAVVGPVAALASRRLWPVAPDTPARARVERAAGPAEISAEGHGLTIVVNRAAGPPLAEDATVALQEELPAANVVESEDGSDVVDLLEQAAGEAKAIGVAGGDGSLNAGAGVAHRRQLPFLAVPAGTLNHLARDLGVETVADAVEAVRDGEVACVDLGCIDDRPFLNTASLGSYVDLVDARERLQRRIGKWPAVLVALIGVLRRSDPVEVELDGQKRRLWMVFIGNCRYHPSGFAPSWRERLDDRKLDVRLVDASRPGARIRLVAAVMTGRLGRSAVYEQFLADELHVRSLNGPLRLARDGETFDGSAEFVICKYDRPLKVYVPSRSDPESPSDGGIRRR